MVKKVDVEETLLKQYSDKELIHYIVSEMNQAYEFGSREEAADLSTLTYRMARIGSCIDLLKAVDKRMNGSNDANIML